MKNLERLVNFSDAVIAIAVTLLVLPLVERAANSHVTSYSQFSSTFGHMLFIFLLSFVVICRFWEGHHGLFSSLKTFNTRLFWLNAAWLVSIALIPFSSELLGNNADNSGFITSFYISSLMLISYIGAAIQWEIVRSSELQKTSIAGSLKGTYGIFSAIGMTLAFVVSIALPTIGVWALVLVMPAGYISRIFDNKEKNKKSPTESTD